MCKLIDPDLAAGAGAGAEDMTYSYRENNRGYPQEEREGKADLRMLMRMPSRRLKRYMDTSSSLQKSSINLRND